MLSFGDRSKSDFATYLAKQALADSGPYALEDGSRIAVVGGGPTGSFFSIFALKLAKMLDKKLKITIYDPKNFTKDGPAGCNR